MCMKSEYMFLTMVIPGPSNPKRLIDVYLQPLIDELLQLWHVGVRTHDHATNQAFMMRAALMWTVNDLPAYGMASGWSTAGIMGCPICMDDTSAFHLQHDRKACNRVSSYTYIPQLKQPHFICNTIRRRATGFPPPPPGRGRGRGRGRGKLVRPFAPDASDAAKASRQPLPNPPFAPAADEPPQSPLIDPTPLDLSSVPPGTSTVGGSFAPSSIPSSVSQAPTTPQETCKFITLAEAQYDRSFHSCIGSVISGHFMQPWKSYKPIPQSQKNFWFEELKAYWNSDEFEAKSAKNKVNRVANPVAANTVYRGGSSSVGMHKRKLEAQLGRPPNRMEVLADCYKKKADGTWSRKRAEEVVKTYQKLLEERVSQPASGEVGSSDGTSSIVQEEQLWAEAAGGENVGPSLGMGLML
ncbi:UNVERIFIED_CONTAM: hypothetical protein Sradi_0865200 [Sesamum radiatum]|uniref:Uncharacterized protein n=1 Tax=Sesamum radiatum TaxID=300843 RepID=A0AAW2V1J3_SESRA